MYVSLHKATWLGYVYGTPLLTFPMLLTFTLYIPVIIRCFHGIVILPVTVQEQETIRCCQPTTVEFLSVMQLLKVQCLCQEIRVWQPQFLPSICWVPKKGVLWNHFKAFCKIRWFPFEIQRNNYLIYSIPWLFFKSYWFKRLAVGGRGGGSRDRVCFSWCIVKKTLLKWI